MSIVNCLKWLLLGQFHRKPIIRYVFGVWENIKTPLIQDPAQYSNSANQWTIVLTSLIYKLLTINGVILIKKNLHMLEFLCMFTFSLRSTQNGFLTTRTPVHMPLSISALASFQCVVVFVRTALYKVQANYRYYIENLPLCLSSTCRKQSLNYNVL